VSDRGDASDVLTGVLENEVGACTTDLGYAEPLGKLCRINSVRPAGQYQQRLTTGVKDQAVGDRAELGVQRCRRRDGGGNRLEERPQFDIDTERAQGGRHFGDGWRIHDPGRYTARGALPTGLQAGYVPADGPFVVIVPLLMITPGSVSARFADGHLGTGDQSVVLQARSYATGSRGSSQHSAIRPSTTR
jgi:hypothetical protein